MSEIIYPEYPMTINKVETSGGFQWVAKFPDILGCSGGGYTQEEAISSARENCIIYLKSLEEDNIPFPQISIIQEDDIVNNCNGKILLRVSKEMHFKIKKAAELNGVSINYLCAEAISEKIGSLSTLDAVNKELNKLTSKIKNVLSSKLGTNKITGSGNTVISKTYKQ